MEQKCRKVYVEVQVKVSPEGEVRPMTIKFEDGELYEIDRLIDRRRACATKGFVILSESVIRKPIFSKMKDVGL